ncbi:cytochrome oxidase putative small subunit CydP [Undibacterium sp. Ren11W]
MVLLLKLLALLFLWKAFFSHPQTKHMRLPTPTVEQHMLSPSGPNSPNAPTPDGASGLNKRPLANTF